MPEPSRAMACPLLISKIAQPSQVLAHARATRLRRLADLNRRLAMAQNRLIDL